MLYMLGRLFKLLLILIIAGALLAVAVIMFVNPNDFKDEITNSLRSYTGQEVTVAGDVQWTFSPEVAIFLEDVKLNGNSTIKQVTIYLDPWSLLSNTLIVEELQISQADILINLGSVQAQPQTQQQTNTDAATDTQSHLQGLNLGPGQGHPQEKAPTATVATTDHKKVTIKHVEVKQTSIKLINSDNNLNLELKNASFEAQDLSLNGVKQLSPIKTTGTLVDLNNNVTLELATTLTAELDKQTLLLDPLSITWHETTFTGSGAISQYTQFPLFTAKLSLEEAETTEILQKLDPYFDKQGSIHEHRMNLAVEFSYYTQGKILDVTKIDLGIDDGTLTGTFKIGFASPYQANFELMTTGINFEPIIKLARATFPATSLDNNLPLQWLKETTMSGKFVGKNLSIDEDFKIDQISFQTIIEMGKVQINPIMLSAYGSIHNMSLFVDVTGNVPFIQLNEQADNVDLAHWEDLLEMQNFMTGTASIKASLEATGNNTQTLLSSLTGGINIASSKGRYSGINIEKLIVFEIDLIKSTFSKLSSGEIKDLNSYVTDQSSKWIDTQTKEPYTEFLTANFKATFTTGVSKESSMTLETSDYTAKANGTIDFVNNTINFDTYIMGKNPPKIDVVKLAKYMQETPFTLKVTGSPLKPIYGPEVRKFTLESIELILTAAMQTATTRMVEATPPNQKTDKTANELFVNSLKELTR